MRGPGGRPLDEWEAREFADIVAHLRDPDDTEPWLHRPSGGSSARSSGPRPLSWRQVLVVLTVSAVVTAACLALPAPWNAWVPVAVMGAVAVAVLLRGLLGETRRRRT